MAMAGMLQRTPAGLYCEAGDFFVDPNAKVHRALITHAHSDHARPGSTHYLCASPGVGVLRVRIGKTASIQEVPYGQRIRIGDVTVSFHPAGHILGSAQLRMERGGEVWGVSGDYKLQPDPTCDAFEPVRCHTFLTESTFGLPLYRWPNAERVFAEIHSWWEDNSRRDVRSVLKAYSLGKAQRLLAGLAHRGGAIAVHPSIDHFLPAYREQGIRLPSVQAVAAERVWTLPKETLWITPSLGVSKNVFTSESDDRNEVTLEQKVPTKVPEIRRVGVASGWMLLNRSKNSSDVDAGFVLSDHADWSGLISSIRATGAERVIVGHGYELELSRWLTEHGIRSESMTSDFSKARGLALGSGERAGTE